MGRPRDEEVRKHFKELGGGRVKCNECGHSFSAGGGSTRMKAHIHKVEGKGVTTCSAKRKQDDDLEQGFNEEGQIQADAKDQETIPELQLLEYVFEHLSCSEDTEVYKSPLSHLKQREFDTLKPEEYLDSLVIDMFAEILTHVEQKKKTVSNWYLPTTFSVAALGNDVENFTHLFRALKLRENYMSRPSLESCEKIFIPVHIGARPNGGHFYLYIIHLKNEEIEIWDSLSDTFVSETQRDVTTKKLLLAMEKLFEEVTFTKFRSKKANNILLQPNGYDCGIFVINYMQQSDNYVKKRNDSFQLQYDSDKERKHLALKLLNSDLNKEKQNLYEKARRYYAAVEKQDANKRLRLDATKGSSEGYLLPTTDLIGSNFQRYIEQIWEWIKDDKVSRIGVWGMGGSGKTALATHIYDKLLEDRPNGGRKVIWVTVSQNNITQLQKIIAKSIELDISDEFEVKIIGRKLLQAFKEMKECVVIILDDVWDDFFLKGVGFPTSDDNRIKLILTTRIWEVCLSMNCEKNSIKVESLDKKDSMNLFKNITGFCEVDDTNDNVYHLENISEGLPLAIVRIGTRMKGKKHASEWRHMLESFENMGNGQYEIDKWVLPVLRCSYDFLTNKLQRFFLYCALSTNGYFRNDDAPHLIRIFVYESIDDNKKLRVQENEGYNMLDILHNHGMLERHLSMWRIHKFFKVLAIGIAEETDTIMANAYKGLKEIPSEDQWKEDLTKVFLTGNKIQKISDGTCLRCSHLSTLLLDGNKNLKNISDDFFSNMPVLKTLDLSKTDIERLPESVSNLKYLIALLLSRCEELLYIPSLRKLTRLISLDLSYTAITQAAIAIGLDSLVNLRRMNLLHSNMSVMSGSLISKLMNLELVGLTTVVEAGMEGLLKLEVIAASFDDINVFNSSVSFLDKNCVLRSFYLTLGDASHDFDSDDVMELKREYPVRRISLVGMDLGNERVELPRGMEELRMRDCSQGRGGRTTLCSVLSSCGPLQINRLVIERCEQVEYLCCLCPDDCSFCSSTELVGRLSLYSLEELKELLVVDVSLPPSSLFSHLTDLQIWGCKSMERVMRSKLLPPLPNLCILSVRDCWKMKEIVGEDDSNEMEVSASGDLPITLPMLTSLELYGMPELINLVYGGGLMRCPSLHTFYATGCSQLKEPQIEISNGCLLQMEKTTYGGYCWQNNW